MKNWQDYVIDADTGHSKLAPPKSQGQPTKEQNQHSTHSSEPKESSKKPVTIWLRFNQFLTGLCVLAVAAGINISIMQSRLSLINTLQNTSFSLLAPGFLLAILYAGEGNTYAIAFYTFLISGILGLALLVNAFCAFFYFLTKRKKYPEHAKKILIFATIPPVFIIVILILLNLLIFF